MHNIILSMEKIECKFKYQIILITTQLQHILMQMLQAHVALNLAKLAHPFLVMVMQDGHSEVWTSNMGRE